MKRNGELQLLDSDKMKTRLLTNMEGLQSDHINVDLIVKKTIAYAQSGTHLPINISYREYSNIGFKTTEMDNLVAETAAYLNILHPDYGRLAARIAVTKLHKETDVSFLEVIKKLYFYLNQSFPSTYSNLIAF